MATFPRGGTEYGGRPGIIQPFPHTYLDDADEQAGLAVRTDSADASSGIEQQYLAEQRVNAKRKTT